MNSLQKTNKQTNKRKKKQRRCLAYTTRFASTKRFSTVWQVLPDDFSLPVFSFVGHLIFKRGGYIGSDFCLGHLDKFEYRKIIIMYWIPMFIYRLKGYLVPRSTAVKGMLLRCKTEWGLGTRFVQGSFSFWNFKRNKTHTAVDRVTSLVSAESQSTDV